MALSRNRSLTPRVVGHYEVLEVLGAGGMGTVYKARDTRLGRLAALKVMRQDWAADEESRRRFLREAVTASALNHPGIVTVYEIGSDAGVDYIAMEHVTGPTLADLLAGGPLPVERALRLAALVADALVAAHAASVVHRDLKPSNIMVPAEDRVKVVDFGLAKVAGAAGPTQETAQEVTARGAVVGTAPYMSPEQAAGRTVDVRSDLFSLGTILYEMLAGRRPFGGESGVSTMAAILTATPPPIPGVGPEVWSLVERCLRKDVGGRFQSAAELEAAIEACLTPRAGSGRPSVAVLPFANMTGSVEDDVLCEGLAEEIINELARVPGLKVIARTSAFAVARMGLDVREAGSRLDVATILEGSVRRSGRRVRVTAELVSTADGGHLWSERYDRELTDILALEDEIAAAIVGQLRVTLDRPGGGAPRTPPDPEAHAAFLEGRYHFARGTPPALAQAVACFERAIARDPRSALAFDAMAELHWYLGFFGNVPPREAFSRATWHAMRALELDDRMGQTHALLGMLRKELDYGWPEVEHEMRRAFELDPGSPLVRLRNAISWLLPLGRVAEGLTELEALLPTDPLSLLLRWWVSVMAFLTRRPARTVAEGRHMIALDPNHFLGHWALGVGCCEAGARDEGAEALARAHELSGGAPFTLGFLAWACGCAGRREDARCLLDRATALASAGYVPPSTFALAHIGLSDWDAAFEWWDRAVEGRDPIIMPIKSFPFFDGLRDDPRYRALLAKMHLSGPPPHTPAGQPTSSDSGPGARITG